jgi:hypothetical protein
MGMHFLREFPWLGFGKRGQSVRASAVTLTELRAA